MLAMPESPRYLLLQGQGDMTSVRKAEAVLLKLRGDHDAVAEELRSILETLGEEGPSVTGCEALRPPPVRRALLLGCGLQLLQQLCGVNTLMYYAGTILQMSSASARGSCIGARLL